MRRLIFLIIIMTFVVCNVAIFSNSVAYALQYKGEAGEKGVDLTRESGKGQKSRKSIGKEEGVILLDKNEEKLRIIYEKKDAPSLPQPTEGK